MARLEIQQVRAPDFSAAGNILAQAGQSFDRGLESAQGLLSSYQEGQKATGDQALLADIASIKDEDGLATFLGSADLANANLSDDMRQHVLGLRDSVIGYAKGRADVEGTRARTDQTRAATSISQAAEGRNAFDHQQGIQDRASNTELAKNYASALAAGQTAGLQGVSLGTPQNDLEASVYEGLIARGLPETAAQGFIMNFRDESGFNPGIEEAEPNVHGTKGRGLYQLTGDRRANFEAIYGDDYSVDNQLDFLMTELTGPESRAAEAILAAQTPGEAGAAIVSNFLRPAEEHRVNRTSRYLSGGNPVTPAQAGLMGAVANASNLTLDDVDRLFGGVNAATDRGQGQIDSRNAAATENAIAASILSAASSPENINATGVIADVSATPGLSPAQQLAAAERAQTAATGPLAGIVTPEVAIDPLVAAQGESDARVRQREIDALPQTSILTTADRYQGNAVGGLIEDLGLGADGEDPRTYVMGLFGESPDSNQLRLHIKDIAQRAGVTEEIAAAAMADQFNRDPWGVNRNDKRFNPDDVVSYLNETMSPEAMQAYEGALVSRDTATGRNQAAQLELTALQAQLSKATDPGRREQLQRQVNQARDQVISGATPQEAQDMLANYIRANGTASRLRGLDPESLEYGKAIEDLRTEIERDPELGDREKSLLISTLAG